MTKTCHVYYHMDADGHCSAGIVQEYLERTHGKDLRIIFQPINYGMKPFVRDIQAKDPVYMVDFCLQPLEDMERFAALCEARGADFTWFDHHRTSLDYENGSQYLKNLPGVRVEGPACCEIVWDFFNKGRPMHPIIPLIAAWDVWRRDNPDWNSMIIPLQTYLRFLKSDPKHNRDFWVWILHMDREDKTKFFREVQETGGMLTQFQYLTEDSRMRGFARIGKFAGYKAIIVNSPQMNSGPFERMREISDVDLMVAWVMNRQGQFTVSIYTQKSDIDLSVLCKRLGEEGPYKSGGGHPGASGFQTDWEHLSRLMEF